MKMREIAGYEQPDWVKILLRLEKECRKEKEDESRIRN